MEIEKEKPEEKEVEKNVTKPEMLELAIDIKPIEREVEGRQGEFIPVVFNITNIGTAEAYNISIIPMPPEGWEFKSALVSFLNVSDSVLRTIFVKAPYTVKGTFAIPVKAVIDNFTVDTDYFIVNVYESKEKYRLEIAEFPRMITLRQNENTTIPILLANTGRVPLTEINGRLENAEECIEFFSMRPLMEINPYEVKSTEIVMKAKGKSTRCNATLILWSKEQVYTFLDISIIITPPPPLLPEITKVNVLLVLLIFLGILVAAKWSNIGERERRMKKLTPKLKAIKIFFYFIYSIIIFIILYFIYNTFL